VIPSRIEVGSRAVSLGATSGSIPEGAVERPPLLLNKTMPKPKPRLYAYAGCGTCRKAIAWLSARGIEVEMIPIRENPPSVVELKTMLGRQGGVLRRLFNTSGQDYRALGLKDTLPGLSEEEALELLAAKGNLVKRPFLLGPGVGLVGFKEEEWAAALG